MEHLPKSEGKAALQKKGAQWALHQYVATLHAATYRGGPMGGFSLKGHVPFGFWQMFHGYLQIPLSSRSVLYPKINATSVDKLMEGVVSLPE